MLNLMEGGACEALEFINYQTVHPTMPEMQDPTDTDGELNQSLDDLVQLLEREIERLKASLTTYRLSKHPQRAEIIRWHVRSLDERQDALEEMQALLLAKPDEDPS